MREIKGAQITEAVQGMCIQANYFLGEDMQSALAGAMEREESPAGFIVLEQLADNARLAGDREMPLCQDTGFSVFFVDVGQDVRITGGSLEEAINEGVRRGYREGLLRASIVDFPISKRVNTGDNTPAVIHTRIVPGQELTIIFDAKGGGSENQSQLRMLKPADGREGVRDFVVEAAVNAGPNACPPLIVGAGVGGTFEKSALLAKRALLRELGEPHPHPEVAALEAECLTAINDSGVGPMGFGGRVTALAVHIETHPCHIASLPVAVNIECHSHRHREVTL
ncbi:MAG: fumarate hydratase [Nitrospinota bacterium]